MLISVDVLRIVDDDEYNEEVVGHGDMDQFGSKMHRVLYMDDE